MNRLKIDLHAPVTAALILTFVFANTAPAQSGPRDPAPPIGPPTVEELAIERVSQWLEDGNDLGDAMGERILARAPTVLELNSRLGIRKRRILGTAIDPAGLLVTKSSELGRNPSCRLQDGSEVEARVLVRLDKYDLALVSVPATGLRAAKPIAGRLARGRLVASVGADGRILSTGVVSVAERNIRPARGGFLGVEIQDDERGGARVSSVEEGSAADAAGLRVDDLIVRIGEDSIDGRYSLVRKIVGKAPGDEIRLGVKRGAEELTLAATLRLRPELTGPSRQQRRLAGGSLSQRNTRFPGTLQHDGILRATQCGGPLLDREGRVVGINIARADRTQSMALGSSTFLRALEELKAKAAPAPSLETAIPETSQKH